MKTILCVTPNAALDRTLIVPDFKPFEVNRVGKVIEVAGGKGVNVARAVCVLGGQSVCAGFLGGDTGKRVARLADAEGLASSWTWIDGETRICTIVVEPNSGQATVVNETGPTVTDSDWHQLQQDLLSVSDNAACVCLSGSIPPGSSLDHYANLLISLQTAGKSVWVDSSGAALATALTVPNLSIKINHEEIGTILQTTIADAADAARAAQQLRQDGAKTVVVTLGSKGAVIAHESGSWWAQPPSIQPVSNVGSGDSFLAGLVVAFDQGLSAGEALCWGVAAGTANTLSAGGGQFDETDFRRILDETRLTAL
jgi:1-phosphofructokinase family hexose kinase